MILHQLLLILPHCSLPISIAFGNQPDACPGLLRFACHFCRTYRTAAPRSDRYGLVLPFQRNLFVWLSTSKALMGVPQRSGCFHHAQHRWTAGFQETPNQEASENEEGYIEPRRVVPGDGGLNHARVTLRWDETKRAEYQLDNQRGSRHRGVESDEQESGHLQSVIFAIDVQDRENDQIGKHECDRAAKTDTAAPEHRRQWNSPDRAYERDHRHHRPADRSPGLGNERVVDNYERWPVFGRPPVT